MHPKKLLYFLVVICYLSPSFLDILAQAEEETKQMPMNRLAKEKSPYLLQHAHNPVDWFPWGEEAFQKAKKEDKPVFLSIGYSTCHWCHVMAHESFENPEIAKVLNENFVSIKVDREERPDIDHTYMAVVTALTGSGGWPLSAFLTPEKEPFYGGTYFPPEAKWGSPGFKDVLLSIADAWKNRRSDVLQSGQSITEALRQEAQKEKISSLVLDKKVFDIAFSQLQRSFDTKYGGFGQQPKFPTSHTLSFLLRYWKRTGNSEALHMVEKTLTEMAKGGMYDHLGGGFHRYATDQKWQIPHFEKMLYDQAILVNSYLEAYQATGSPLYARIAKEIFDYVLRDMQQKQGGFFSAEDADSVDPDGIMPADQKEPHKKEGAFFLWKEKEINQILGKEDVAVFNYFYGVLPDGNADLDPHGEFIGKNVLCIAHDLKETADHFEKSAPEIEVILKHSKEKLFDVRSKRPKPHLDNKILVDWNGLMISSLAVGSRVLNNGRYRQAAENAAQFILKNLVTKEGRLLHRYRDGESAISATVSDYAFFIHGLIDLYEATFNASYLKEAKRLAHEMLRLFWDKKNGGFFLTAIDSEEILFKQKEIYDGAIPSGNSMAALDLVRLAALTLDNEFDNKAQALFRAFADEVAPRASAYAQLLIALDFAIGPSKEIVIAGDAASPQTAQMIKQVFKPFLPNKIVVFRSSKTKEAAEIISLSPFIKEKPPVNAGPTAYVCENHTCKLPTNDLKKLEELLSGN